MFKEPDFLNTLLKETDGFSKYVKLSINYRGRKLSHALLLFHRSLIIKARKVFVILHSAMCYTLTRGFQWKKTITEKKKWKSHKSDVNGMPLSIGKCDCSFGRQFLKFQFNLQRTLRSGRNAGEKVTVLTSGWIL